MYIIFRLIKIYLNSFELDNNPKNKIYEFKVGGAMLLYFCQFLLLCTSWTKSSVHCTFDVNIRLQEKNTAARF